MAGATPIGWIAAELPPLTGVVAGTTTRAGGVSSGSRRGLNLGAGTGDDPLAVACNRERLAAALRLPAEPLWLRQVHGTCVVRHDGRVEAEPEADAAIAFGPGRVLAVLTADCLPVVIAARDGSRVGLAHAGWRGLAAGVLENTVAALGGGGLVAWLGPAIGPAAFEVGAEVRSAFVARDPAAAAAFAPNRAGRWQADLWLLARQRLARAGVDSVTGGGLCTHSDAARFYSFRRERDCGRLATLAWLR